MTADRTPSCPGCQPASKLAKLLSSPGLVGRRGASRRVLAACLRAAADAGGDSCACRMNSSAPASALQFRHHPTFPSLDSPAHAWTELAQHLLARHFSWRRALPEHPLMTHATEVKALTDKVLNMAKADAAEVDFTGGERSATRFANSNVTANMVQFEQTLTLTLYGGAKTASVHARESSMTTR